MVIVRLFGGLGNQFFQYALARHLAQIHGTSLKLDISEFKTYKLHRYSLWPFNIQESFATSEEVAALSDPKPGYLERFLTKILSRPPKPLRPSPYYIQERHFHFDPEILRLPDNIYLKGYWQSEKYFINISDTIRREFTVKTEPVGVNKSLIEKMSSGNSVSLHIRRGDYVFDSKFSQFHGVCALDYYSRCAEYISRVIKNTHFFIFSDDPDWACYHLRLPYTMTIVEYNGADKNFEDLRLMSCCKYNIIANSTFSWWAAWLNQNPEKIVFAPKRWFKDHKYDTRDLIPDKWIRV